MTRVTIIVSLWLLLVGTISDSVTAPGSEHGPLELLAIYAVVTALALAALWIHLAEDPADALHPPRRQPFRWD
jgi:peptidoglycan/LPS O-acetylase OafA/YrhL